MNPQNINAFDIYGIDIFFSEKPLNCKQHIPEIRELQEYLDKMEQSYDIVHYHKRFSVIQYNEVIYAVPNEFLDIKLLKNYDNISISELRTIATAGTDAELTGIIPHDESNISRGVPA